MKKYIVLVVLLGCMYRIEGADQQRPKLDVEQAEFKKLRVDAARYEFVAPVFSGEIARLKDELNAKEAELSGQRTARCAFEALLRDRTSEKKDLQAKNNELKNQCFIVGGVCFVVGYLMRPKIKQISRWWRKPASSKKA